MNLTAKSDAKKAYVTPALVQHGSVRNMTGGSKGAKGDGTTKDRV
jgi:hypothetical protein